MTIDILLKSYKLQCGGWKPAATIFIHMGDYTEVLVWDWVNQEFDNKDGADIYAKFASKQSLLRRGFLKENFRVQ